MTELERQRDSNDTANGESRVRRVAGRIDRPGELHRISRLQLFDIVVTERRGK